MTGDVLYRRYKSRVYHWCLRFAGGREDWAEDVAHDVFLRLFERIDDLDEDRNLDGLVSSSQKTRTPD